MTRFILLLIAFFVCLCSVTNKIHTSVPDFGSESVEKLISENQKYSIFAWAGNEALLEHKTEILFIPVVIRAGAPSESRNEFIMVVGLKASDGEILWDSNAIRLLMASGDIHSPVSISSVSYTEERKGWFSGCPTYVSNEIVFKKEPVLVNSKGWTCFRLMFNLSPPHPSTVFTLSAGSVEAEEVKIKFMGYEYDSSRSY